MNRNIITIIFFVFLSQFVFSQKYNFEKLDKYFDNLEENNAFMGTVAISKSNELIYTKSVGFLDF
ncbi:MAG: peptidase, partial [Lutibacter sp.]|nr:peptidase [Lutibacter sp.]